MPPKQDLPTIIFLIIQQLKKKEETYQYLLKQVQEAEEYQQEIILAALKQFSQKTEAQTQTEPIEPTIPKTTSDPRNLINTKQQYNQFQSSLYEIHQFKSDIEKQQKQQKQQEPQQEPQRKQVKKQKKQLNKNKESVIQVEKQEILEFTQEQINEQCNNSDGNPLHCEICLMKFFKDNQLKSQELQNQHVNTVQRNQ